MQPPPLNLFEAEMVDDVLVVSARNISGTYRYNDLHLDCNTLRSFISRFGVKKLIFDLASLTYFGSELIAGLILVTRDCERQQGVVALCNISHYVSDSLSVIRFFDNHAKFPDRTSALEHFLTPASA
ncbi:MAG: STAS domain-containing protein [Rubinisphaera brasiliensis]|uniref:STAS domain-containing protein n=1 Tax=Rubinisphaera brasiliensis (strain ATCC 49424 / DSM 5305 / JCM 21570 / IAM 15109 / NBRC 103401 / IFAM 1448) TaxID=756272 RepID=F0SLD7_RUBBR|nr:STAS domain-containing protein [Rubinisphaera brasiliensis]ADY62043.1 hypothetical protein Plabr_4471 [Rubinisphaera brasiliensis DSM 5305]MBR9800719.1 STAS domain-containing protein [bacterium]